MADVSIKFRKKSFFDGQQLRVNKISRARAIDIWYHLFILPNSFS